VWLMYGRGPSQAEGEAHVARASAYKGFLIPRIRQP